MTPRFRCWSWHQGRRQIGYIDIALQCPNEDEDKKKAKKENKELPARSFVYCFDELEGWVFIPKATSIPCEKGQYLIRSFIDDDEAIPADAFDILSHSKATWVVSRASIGNEAILTNFVVESTQKISADFLNCGGDGKNGLVRTDKDEALQRPFLPLDEKYYPEFDFEKRF